MLKKTLAFTLAGVLMLAGAAVAGPQEKAEIIKAAEKEGVVTWQCGLKASEAKPIVEAFHKAYPKIKLVQEKESGSKEKLLREVLAGAETKDVIQLDPDVENEFIEMDLLAKVNWDDFGVLPELQFHDGRMVGTYQHTHVFAFNTNLLKKEDAPKTWNDLLLPKWKGKFTVDTSCNAYVRLVDAWGADKVIAYLKKLGQQKPIFVRGHTNTMTLMAAGQYMLSVDVLLASANFVKMKGGPLDFIAPDTVPAGMVKNGILKKNVEHPNAARVFLGWMGAEGYKYVEKGNPARAVAFGDTFTARLCKGKKMSWTPTTKELPDRQAFFNAAIEALGVPR